MTGPLPGDGDDGTPMANDRDEARSALRYIPAWRDLPDAQLHRELYGPDRESDER